MRIRKTALRGDHKLIKKVFTLRNDIDDVCNALSEEVGFPVNWNDAQRLMNGFSPQKVNNDRIDRTYGIK